MSDNIVRGHFSHFRQPPEPERQKKKEAAQAEDLGIRMNMWLVHAEQFLGLSATRAMLLNALHWVDTRLAYKKGTGQ